MPSHQTTKPDAITIAGFPLLDADQRRRVATKLATVGIAPTDAAHAAARLAVGVDTTTPGAFAPQWAPITTPDLRATTNTDESGMTATRVVGWWAGLELPLFRIGGWTPNGRDTYTRHHGITGERDDIKWPVAKVGTDGAWTVRLTKQAQGSPPRMSDGMGTQQWVQPRTGTGRWVTSTRGAAFPRPRTIPEGSEATLFGGGRITATAVFVRFTTGAGKPLRSAWVALDGLGELTTARDHLNTLATRWYRISPEPRNTPELHELLTKTNEWAPDVPLATGIRLLHTTDIPTAERLLTANPLAKRTTKGDDTADVVAAFRARLATQMKSTMSKDTPNADRHYPGGYLTTPDVLAQDLSVKWMVSPQTARKRLAKVLNVGAPGILSLTTVAVNRDRAFAAPSRYSHRRSGVAIIISDYGRGPRTFHLYRATIDNFDTLVRSSRPGPTLLLDDDQFTTFWQAQVEAIDVEHATAREAAHAETQRALADAAARLSTEELNALRALETLARTLGWTANPIAEPTHASATGLHLAITTILSGPEARAAYDTLTAQGWTPPST